MHALGIDLRYLSIKMGVCTKSWRYVMLHLLMDYSHPLRPLSVTWIKSKKKGCVERGCSGALKPGKLSLSCRAIKCSDDGAGNLDVLTTHETSPCFSDGDVGSTRTR